MKLLASMKMFYYCIESIVGCSIDNYLKVPPKKGNHMATSKLLNLITSRILYLMVPQEVVNYYTVAVL